MACLETLVPSLTCLVPETQLIRVAAILQAGFFLDVPSATPLRTVLTTLPGFDPDYIDNRIQTIFYNGNAIDDLDQPVGGGTATLALSAAMPGLAGAILRKGSPHAALRSAAHPAPPVADGMTARVHVKLFNAVIAERGPALLTSGVIMKAADIASFFALRPRLLAEQVSLRLDGAPCSARELAEVLGRVEVAHLQVEG